MLHYSFNIVDACYFFDLIFILYKEHINFCYVYVSVPQFIFCFASVLRAREELFGRKKYEKCESNYLISLKNETGVKFAFFSSEYCAAFYTLLFLSVPRIVFSYVFLTIKKKKKRLVNYRIYHMLTTPARRLRVAHNIF